MSLSFIEQHRIFLEIFFECFGIRQLTQQVEFCAERIGKVCINTAQHEEALDIAFDAQIYITFSVALPRA